MHNAVDLVVEVPRPVVIEKTIEAECCCVCFHVFKYIDDSLRYLPHVKDLAVEVEYNVLLTEE